MKTLGIIPARGGSKGVPRKNIAPLGGRPLLAYTAEAALGARRLDRIVLTTDDEEIAAVGRDCGLEVPFLRPVELAADTSASLPVVQHAVQMLERDGYRPDAICLLQPTHPLRQSGLIDAAIQLLEIEAADSVVTVVPVPVEHHPRWVYCPTADGSLRLAMGDPEPVSRRQDLPPAFCREGSVYVVRRDVVIEGQSLYGKRTVGLPVDPEESVNIDTPADLARAERILTARHDLFPVMGLQC